MAKKGSTGQQTVALAALYDVAAFAAGFAATRGFKPILLHLLFQEDRIIAGDGTVGVVWQAPTRFATPFTLHAERLVKLLGAMLPLTKEITLEPGAGGGRLRLSGGGFQADLAMLKPEEYPLPALPTTGFQPVGEGWGGLVRQVLFSASLDEQKPALRGVRAQGPWIQAADNYRITRVRQARPIDAHLPESLLSRLGARLDNVRALAMTEHHLVLDFAEGQAFGSRLAVEFPKVAQLFTAQGKALAADKGHVGVTLEEPRLLSEALERMMLFTREEELHRVQLTATAEGVHLQTVELPKMDGEAAAVERAEERVPCNVTGPGRRAGRTVEINARMFLESWQRCPRVFLPTDPQTAHIYFQAEDTSFECLLPCLMLARPEPA